MGHSDPTNEATEYHVRISDFPEQPHFSYKLDCQDQASTGVAPQPKRRKKTQSTLQVILIPEKYLSPSAGFPNRVSDRARSRPKEVPQLRSSFLPHTMPSAYGGGGGDCPLRSGRCCQKEPCQSNHSLQVTTHQKIWGCFFGKEKTKGRKIPLLLSLLCYRWSLFCISQTSFGNSTCRKTASVIRDIE